MSIPSLPGPGDAATWPFDPAAGPEHCLDGEDIRETAAGAVPIDPAGRDQARIIDLLLDDGILSAAGYAVRAEIVQILAATRYDGSCPEALGKWLDRQFQDCADATDEGMERERFDRAMDAAEENHKFEVTI